MQAGKNHGRGPDAALLKVMDETRHAVRVVGAVEEIGRLSGEGTFRDKLQPSRNEGLLKTASLGSGILRQGKPGADFPESGESCAGIHALMIAGEAEHGAFRNGRSEGNGRVKAFCAFPEHGFGGGKLGRGDDGRRGAYGVGFVVCYGFERGAEDGRVIKSYGGVADEIRSRSRGGIVAGAESRFHDGALHAAFTEQEKGHDGENLKVGKPRFGLPGGQGCLKPLFFAERPAVHKNAFGRAHEMRRCVEARGDACLFEEGSKKRCRGTLAIRAAYLGYEKGRSFEPQFLKRPVHTGQGEIHVEKIEFIQIIQKFLECLKGCGHELCPPVCGVRTSAGFGAGRILAFFPPVLNSAGRCSAACLCP